MGTHSGVIKSSDLFLGPYFCLCRLVFWKYLNTPLHLHTCQVYSIVILLIRTVFSSLKRWKFVDLWLFWSLKCSLCCILNMCSDLVLVASLLSWQHWLTVRDSWFFLFKWQVQCCLRCIYSQRRAPSALLMISWAFPDLTFLWSFQMWCYLYPSLCIPG